MAYFYKRDILITNYFLTKENAELEFIKLTHDGDYSLAHQKKQSEGKTFIWKGGLSEETRIKLVDNLVRTVVNIPLSDESAKRIYRVSIEGYQLEDIATPDTQNPNLFNVDPAKISFEDFEIPFKVCKHCGNIYLPDYDFIEDEVMCEHLNSMFGGTYEYPADWPDYCAKCLEELYELDTATSIYKRFKERDVIK